MKRWKTALAIMVFAMVATVASSAVDATAVSTYPDIMGCETGCATAAAGWPFPYLVDYPAISPVGSVSLAGGLLGIDKIRHGALAATFLAWLGIGRLAAWLVRRRSGRAPGAPG